MANENWRLQNLVCAVGRLKLLLSTLKELNAQHFTNIVTEANDNRDATVKVQIDLQADPLNPELQKEEKERDTKFIQSAYLVEMFLQTKSKAT